MLNKIAGLANALGVILAVVAAFVAIPNLQVALVLVVLGLIAGLMKLDENLNTGLYLSVLVLPIVAAALVNIPSIGTQLGAVATNLALVLAGMVATMIAITTVVFVKNEITGLFK
jgi:hypothetical protein